MARLLALVAVLALAVSVAAVPVKMQPKKSGLVAPSPNAMCVECKKIIGKIQDAVAAANSTYGKELQDFFDTKICPQMPPDSQKQCSEYVDTEIPAMWEKIVDEILDPVEACKELELCSSNAGVADIVECKICKQAAKFVDKKIFEDPAVDAKVADALASMCKAIPNVPATGVQKCEVLVRNNTAEFMMELGHLIGTQLCKDTGMCMEAGNSALVQSAPAPPSPTMCDECKDIVKEMQDFVSDTNSTYSAQVEDFMDKRVCPQMPKEFQKDCVAYLHKTLPQVWDAVINQLLDPLSACDAMGLCDKSANDVYERVSLHGNDEDVVHCKMCKQATKLIAMQFFEDADVEAKVATELVKVCDKIPDATAAMKAKCVTQIQEDTPALMKEMGEALKLHFCVEAKICPV